MGEERRSLLRSVLYVLVVLPSPFFYFAVPLGNASRVCVAGAGATRLGVEGANRIMPDENPVTCCTSTLVAYRWMTPMYTVRNQLNIHMNWTKQQNSRSFVTISPFLYDSEAIYREI